MAEIGAGAGVLLFMLSVIVVVPRSAHAVPSFATQTGQPCSSCHVGAFGPQLKPYGRSFKLHGYVASDGGNHFPPLALITIAGFTHTQADQAGGAAPGFKANDNFADQEVQFFYAGRVTPTIGMFTYVGYDAILHKFHWDNLDIRHASDAEFFGHDVLVGMSINNVPTVQDVWNSTPIFGFPYNTSALAPTPSASTLVDGNLNHNVLGAGVYTLWDKTVYAELMGYGHLSSAVQKGLGNDGVDGSDTFPGVIPYWRLALQHDAGHHYFEAGTYGLYASRYPGGVTTFGTDSLTDVAFDANYQYTGSADHFVSAHATVIAENMRLGANSALNGTNGSDRLNTARADLSYSYKDTFTPTVQLFRTWGSADTALYPATPNGVPDSAGYIAELAYVPGGKPGLPFYNWANARFTLQYVGYTEFDGVRQHASNNNTVFLSLRIAADLFKPLEGIGGR